MLIFLIEKYLLIGNLFLYHVLRRTYLQANRWLDAFVKRRHVHGRSHLLLDLAAAGVVAVFIALLIFLVGSWWEESKVARVFFAIATQRGLLLGAAECILLLGWRLGRVLELLNVEV